MREETRARLEDLGYLQWRRPRPGHSLSLVPSEPLQPARFGSPGRAELNGTDARRPRFRLQSDTRTHQPRATTTQMPDAVEQSSMRDPAEVREELAALEPQLQEEYPIGDLGIFGSDARGEQRPESDLDVVVTFEGPVTPTSSGWRRS